MRTQRRLLLLGVVVSLSGLAGFWISYASVKEGMLEFLGTLAKAPEIESYELAYAFAPPEQVAELIRREPRQPAKWARAEEKVELLRKLRLAVIAQSPPEQLA